MSTAARLTGFGLIVLLGGAFSIFATPTRAAIPTPPVPVETPTIAVSASVPATPVPPAAPPTTPATPATVPRAPVPSAAPAAPPSTVAAASTVAAPVQAAAAPIVNAPTPQAAVTVPVVETVRTVAAPAVEAAANVAPATPRVEQAVATVSAIGGTAKQSAADVTSAGTQLAGTVAGGDATSAQPALVSERPRNSSSAHGSKAATQSLAPATPPDVRATGDSPALVDSATPLTQFATPREWTDARRQMPVVDDPLAFANAYPLAFAKAPDEDARETTAPMRAPPPWPAGGLAGFSFVTGGSAAGSAVALLAALASLLLTITSLGRRFRPTPELAWSSAYVALGDRPG